MAELRYHISYKSCLTCREWTGAARKEVNLPYVVASTRDLKGACNAQNGWDFKVTYCCSSWKQRYKH